MNFLAAIAAKIVQWLITKTFTALKNFLVNWWSDRKQKKVNKQNAGNLQDKVNQGASNEEIADATEDLLNGANPK